jgi:hypothetical protein
MPAFACISFAQYRDIHRDRRVIARRIVKRQGLVADRPFARGELRDRHQRGKRNENSNSTFHVRPRRFLTTFSRSSGSSNPRGGMAQVMTPALR